jgi:hypothetical protein
MRFTVGSPGESMWAKPQVRNLWISYGGSWALAFLGALSVALLVSWVRRRARRQTPRQAWSSSDRVIE